MTLLFGGLFLVFLQSTFVYSEYLDSEESISAAPLSISARKALEESLKGMSSAGGAGKQDE